MGVTQSQQYLRLVPFLYLFFTRWVELAVAGAETQGREATTGVSALSHTRAHGSLGDLGSGSKSSNILAALSTTLRETDLLLFLDLGC